MGKKTWLRFEFASSALLSFQWFDQVCSNAQKQPKEFNKSDDTYSYAKSKQSTNSRKEIDPSLTGKCLILNNCWGLEIDLQNGNVFLIGLISCWLKYQFLIWMTKSNVCHEITTNLTVTPMLFITYFYEAKNEIELENLIKHIFHVVLF